jgi:hypothetical protein
MRTMPKMRLIIVITKIARQRFCLLVLVPPLKLQINKSNWPRTGMERRMNVPRYCPVDIGLRRSGISPAAPAE